MRQVRQEAQIAIQHAQELMTKAKSTLWHYRPFSQGQRVWLEGKNLSMTHPTTKLAPKQFSPFKISRVLSPVVYQLILLAQWKQKKIHNVFHASLLTPYHETEAHRVNYLEPPPDIIDGEEEYEVEKVLDSKRVRRNKKLHYLIRWKGYSEAHDTWELEDNVEHTQKLVEQFHHQHPITTQKCYLSKEDHGDEDPSAPSKSPMSSNALQSSSKSDLSLPIDWTPYPALPHDNGPVTLSPAQGNQCNPTSLTTTISRLTITNCGAVKVVGAAPIWVRTTTTATTSAQPTTTIHPPLQCALRHHHPAWTFLDPEICYSDGEQRQINPSPTSTSLYTDSYVSTPLSPQGRIQSPPSMGSITTSAFQTAPSGPVSPPNLPSPPCSDHGLEGQDERAHYLGEGTQRYFGGCRAIQWYQLGEGYNWHYYILVPNVAGYLEPAQWLAMAPKAPEPVIFGRTNFISPIYVEPLHARAAWHFTNPTIDDTNHSLLVTDHPCRGQMDAAILLLDNPGVTAEIHWLCLLDAKDRITNQVELHHVLETPLGPQRCTIEQQEWDTQLMEERVTWQEQCAAVGTHLVAAAAMSCLLPIFHGIYGEAGGVYPPGLYLTRGRPATHSLMRGEDIPQALLIYIPPTDQLQPVWPHHGTPPSPSALDDGSTLFKDNNNGEAWVHGSTLVGGGVMLRYCAICSTLMIFFLFFSSIYLFSLPCMISAILGHEAWHQGSHVT